MIIEKLWIIEGCFMSADRLLKCDGLFNDF